MGCFCIPRNMTGLWYKIEALVTVTLEFLTMAQ